MPSRLLILSGYKLEKERPSIPKNRTQGVSRPPPHPTPQEEEPYTHLLSGVGLRDHADDGHVKEGAGGRKAEIMAFIPSPEPTSGSRLPCEGQLLFPRHERPPQIHCSSQPLSAHSPLPFSFLHQPQLPALRGQQPPTSRSSP